MRSVSGHYSHLEVDHERETLLDQNALSREAHRLDIRQDRERRGQEYTACLHRNGRSSCTCPAGERGRSCYHVKHLRNCEAERSGQHVETKRAAEKAEKVPVSAQTGKKDSQRQQQEAATADVERMMNAPLTGNRLFRLMR